MILYDSTLAPNPRRVRIFLAEKGVEVPVQPVDIGSAENREPEFLEKNELGGLPVLGLDDGTCIAESVAICRYFEETNPEPPLMGVDAADRALVEMWNRRMELEIFNIVTSAFRNTHDKACHIIIAFRVKSGHFSCFSTNKGAFADLTSFCYSFYDITGNINIEFIYSKIIEKKERFGAPDSNIINTHSHQIYTYGVMLVA